MTDRGVKHSTTALITERMFRALDLVISSYQTGRIIMKDDDYQEVYRAWYEGGGRAQLATEGGDGSFLADRG